MVRRGAFVLGLALVLGLSSVGTAAAAPDGSACGPGAPGIGDPYFPTDGNGGYDVGHYALDLAYDPESDVLDGHTAVTAEATQDLSSFNLDLQGLEVSAVTVDGEPAGFSREGAELTVTPAACVAHGSTFVTEVTYAGVPETLEDGSGFVHTDDGMVVIGQPDVAALWFPANDHPLDKAAFTFRITVPEGLQAIANGVLEGEETADGSTTFTWSAEEPMAPYLAMATVGEYDVRAYESDGIRFWDALDPDLFDAVATPRTGERFGIAQAESPGYKRLLRTISVPAEGAELSFQAARDTEPGFDFFFVEAHAPGTDEWTTLPDAAGIATQDTGVVCPGWLALHPFLAHYQTDNGDETCSPAGTSGDWWAVSGRSDGYEQWTVDLSAYAGTDVEVALTYVSDEVVAFPGVFVDDIEVSTGEGATSFEDDGDTFDGWTTPDAPEGSPPNAATWISGTAEDSPTTIGALADASLARQPEILEYLSGLFGPYPFSASGGIVDDTDAFGFALENQTRPIYARAFFTDQVSGDSVVVHELTHQWFGDSLAVEAWQHIWLNEGFATYAEWLWSEHDGLETTQEIVDSVASTPADDPFWSVTIGDPGPDGLFDLAVYNRGALTLHALRQEVGDDAFFQILRDWASAEAGGNVTTDEFVALAEDVSGQQLDDLFTTWLFTPAKPPGLPE